MTLRVDIVTTISICDSNFSNTVNDLKMIENSQAIADHYSFIECVEDLLSDYYEMSLNYIEKDDSFDVRLDAVLSSKQLRIIVDFNLLIRHKELKFNSAKRIEVIADKFCVDNKVYQDYLEAYLDLSDEVDRYMQ